MFGKDQIKSVTKEGNLVDLIRDTRVPETLHALVARKGDVLARRELAKITTDQAALFILARDKYSSTELLRRKDMLSLETIEAAKNTERQKKAMRYVGQALTFVGAMGSFVTGGSLIHGSTLANPLFDAFVLTVPTFVLGIVTNFKFWTYFSNEDSDTNKKN